MGYLTKTGHKAWNPFAELDHILRDFGAGWVQRAPAEKHWGGEFLVHVEEDEGGDE